MPETMLCVQDNVNTSFSGSVKSEKTTVADMGFPIVYTDKVLDLPSIKDGRWFGRSDNINSSLISLLSIKSVQITSTLKDPALIKDW